MDYKQLINHFGSQANAARALGLRPPSVSEWKKKGVPLPRQAQYEILTNGKLRADRPNGEAKCVIAAFCKNNPANKRRACK